MGLLDWLFGSAASQVHEEMPEPVHLAPGRGFTFEVVGEANYQDTLDAICGGKCEDGHRLPIRAQLVFQENNPHDRNAIAVLIYRDLVCYVPRDMAREMRSAILALNPQERPVTCDAQVVGGWLRDEDDEGHYGVRLSLAHPLRSA